MPEIQVKICGVTNARDVADAVQAGAGYLGLNFFPKSPRYVDLQLARALALEVPSGVAKVALTVNADDALQDAIVDHVPLDMLQLHGSESPQRVADLRTRYGLPIIKAIGISGPADLAKIDAYGSVADQLLVDAKPPKGAVLPGGNGVSFDWSLLSGRKYWQLPWLLAGGLTPENVAEAIQRTGAQQVDVSSAVEVAPGRKDAALMTRFVQAARTARDMPRLV